MAHAGSDLTLRTRRTAAVPDGSRSLAPSQREPRLVAVGPGPAIPDQSPVFGSTMQVHEYPVQDGKIQPPLLPEETLQRDRLLDWLHAKVRGRLVLILADAGYGKTTLLADWTRRTRVRALWYRLDEHDRDWPVFIRHIVAAGREIDPGFAPQTEALLRELGTPLTDRPTVVRTLQGELQAWATTGTALVLDDWHAVDDVPEIRDVVRELILRGPDRLTVVIASRRRPTLPVARLRAIGEAAEISTDDLRFDRDETERLFRDSYKHPLERDLLDDLARTTDGWAATLRLVESAVRGRPREEVRAVIRSLSGRHGDLHDYLAEEVVGRMSLEQQSFVERCSILGVATAELAAVAAQVSCDEARSHLDAAESYGLLARRGRTGQAGRLFHPLVRTFLEGRLLDAVGDSEVRATHARVARAAEAVSWAVSGHHYAAAGLTGDVARVLAGAVPTILGSGAHEEALLIAGTGDRGPEGAWYDVIAAHGHLRRAEPNLAESRARAALSKCDAGDESVSHEVAVLTVMNAAFVQGYADEVEALRIRLTTRGSRQYAAMAHAMAALMAALQSGSIEQPRELYRELGREFSSRSLDHFAGIAALNEAWCSRAMGDSIGASTAAQRAVELLERSSAASEVGAARMLLAWAAAHEGRLLESATMARAAIDAAPAGARFEALVEAADLEACYGDGQQARRLLDDARAATRPHPGYLSFARLVESIILIREGRAEAAHRLLGEIPRDEHTGYPGFHGRCLVQFATCQVVAGIEHPEQAIRAARVIARDQQAALSLAEADLLAYLVDPASEGADNRLESLSAAHPVVLALQSEAVALSLDRIPEAVLRWVSASARVWSVRWRSALRLALDDGEPRRRLRAAEVLEEIGESLDIARLRHLSHELKGGHRSVDLGRRLARRVASRVFVEDLGRVQIRIGDRTILGTDIRRKALALLCFLLSRPQASAPRDQVLEALWPDQSPDQAINSLHQTSYFLRRVFEPEYDDDLSPGYLRYENDLLWLDQELVDSRSRRFRRVSSNVPRDPSPEDASVVSSLYLAKFALDFEYDEWASMPRETMHARYLEIVERAVALDIEGGHVGRAIQLSERALQVDPDLDAVERSVIKMYRLTGAHAAAAELYGHYAAGQRDLGLDPEPLEDL